MVDDREYQAEFGAGDGLEARRPLARQLARKITQEFRLKEPPVEVAILIQARGLRLVLSAVAGALSGQLFPKQSEIFVNTCNRSTARQRFTMAHELGHWELRHYLNEELPPDSQGFEGVYEAQGSYEGRSPIEIEANTFAAELLMPGAWIKREKRPLAAGRANELAELYGVSREAMFYQLMHYKMI
jgi:Zn-dependent peptidase ImmA (M78 family)